MQECTNQFHIERESNFIRCASCGGYWKVPEQDKVGASVTEPLSAQYASDMRTPSASTPASAPVSEAERLVKEAIRLNGKLNHLSTLVSAHVGSPGIAKLQARADEAWGEFTDAEAAALEEVRRLERSCAGWQEEARRQLCNCDWREQRIADLETRLARAESRAKVKTARITDLQRHVEQYKSVLGEVQREREELYERIQQSSARPQRAGDSYE